MANPILKKEEFWETADQKKVSLKSKVLEVIKISTIPDMLRKIMEVTEDPKTGVADLEKIIEHDQSIASRVVGVSNAVFYGFPRKISSISQAILVLGFEMVKGLAISTTVFNTVSVTNRANLTDLWRHSFRVAMASVVVAKRTGLVNRESAFLAGLLHDIGRPILYQVCGKEYLDLCALDKNCLEREAEVFGATHAEAGAWFADKCKLPDDCVRAIKFHHTPEAFISEGNLASPLSAIVYLGNLVAIDRKDAYALISTHHAAVLKALGLDTRALVELTEEMAELKGDITAFYS